MLSHRQSSKDWFGFITPSVVFIIYVYGIGIFTGLYCVLWPNTLAFAQMVRPTPVASGINADPRVRRICSQAEQAHRQLLEATEEKDRLGQELQSKKKQLAAIRAQYSSEQERAQRGSGRLRGEIQSLERRILAQDRRIRSLKKVHEEQKQRCDTARGIVGELIPQLPTIQSPNPGQSDDSEGRTAVDDGAPRTGASPVTLPETDSTVIQPSRPMRWATPAR